MDETIISLGDEDGNMFDFVMVGEFDAENRHYGIFLLKEDFYAFPCQVFEMTDEGDDIGFRLINNEDDLIKLYPHVEEVLSKVFSEDEN